VDRAVDVDALETDAVTATGLDDFGDPTYRDGLLVLAGSLTEEARLTDLGYAAVETQIGAALRNRLRVVDWIATHPEVAEEEVAAPLVVVGLPRTGTTLLSGLLAADPRRRPLYRWEATDPVPPPETGALATDPRIAAAEAASGLLDALNPGFKAIHHEPAAGPTECVTLLAQHFASLLWETLANVPAYGRWLLAVDQDPAYAHHHRVLQVLQSRAPGRWSLKSPHHGLAPDALLRRYPDARVVVTHRDPVPVIGSLCSLVRSLSGTFSDADHTAYIRTHWLDVAAAIIGRTAAARDHHPGAAFLDVEYDRLVADPIGVLREIADFDGLPLTPDVEDRMRAYLATHTADRFGRHVYSLEEFGLHPEEVRERLGGS
jgi:hypothetical protein